MLSYFGVSYSVDYTGHVGSLDDNTASSDRISYQLITELVVAKLMSHDVIMIINVLSSSKAPYAAPFPYKQGI